VTHSTEHRSAIAALGYELGPTVLPAVFELFNEEQSRLAAEMPALARDLAYGPDPRQRLDVYAPISATQGRAAPIMVFVPGGGFLRGDKGEDWKNANVGRMAARAGFLGTVINYRLAPDHQWPAGGEDVAAAVAWLKAHAAEHGGDPQRIVLVGTSAGAVHLATWLKLGSRHQDVRALVLLSGLYGATPLDERDTLYYGDQSLYPERMPFDAVAETDLPIMLACAEFDPPRFQAEFLGMLQRRIASKGSMPRACILSGHNHYSMVMHLGGSDTRLADEIIAFANESLADQ